MSPLRIAPVVTAADLEVFALVHAKADPSAPAESPTPEMECFIAWDRNDPVARCSVSVAVDLVGAPGNSGLVGHYDAITDAAGVELLRHAAHLHAARGAMRVLGPMNGSTWGRYRLALAAQAEDPQGSPPFFLGEPRNPFHYPSHFDQAGFHIIASYESRSFNRARDAVSPGSAVEPALPAALSALGITIHSLDPAALAPTLEEVYALSLDAFAQNPYYSPIDAERFAAPFLALRPLLDPRLVLLARDDVGALVSLLFGYPDPLVQSAGRPLRAIVKTLATVSRFRGARIARHLLEVFRARAFTLGFEQIVHALMHVANTSMRLSAEHRSERFRSYSLYEWTP